MFRRILVTAGAAALFSVFASAAFANHSWGSYHWGRTANPFSLTVIDTTSPGWTSYVNTAVNDWNAAAPINLTKTTGSANKRCAAVAGKVQVCSDTYGRNGWLGLATIWTLSGTTHIAQATTKLNDSYFNTSTYNNPNERAHVACQEIGHDFGLDHQSETGADLNTCMDYFSNTGSNAGSTHSTHPNGGDYDELVCIYDATKRGSTISSPPHSCTGTGHLDSSNSYTTATGVVQAPGRDGIFVSHHGDMTEISHVYWANPIH